MRADFAGLGGLDRLARDLSETGRESPRAVGRANGRAADRVAAETQREVSRRGWGATTEVWARRGAGGSHDPTAYTFMSGGGAWQETGTSLIPPRPVLGPAFDRVVTGLAGMAADEAVRGL